MFSEVKTCAEQVRKDQHLLSPNLIQPLFPLLIFHSFRGARLSHLFLKLNRQHDIVSYSGKRIKKKIASICRI